MATGIGDDRDSAPAARASGIVAVSDHQGDTRHVVPASRRPDGTLRKERAVRPGYTPPEDIQWYRPPAHREGNRSAPGSPAATHTLQEAPESTVHGHRRHPQAPKARPVQKHLCRPVHPAADDPITRPGLGIVLEEEEEEPHCPLRRSEQRCKAIIKQQQQTTPVSYTSTDVFTSPNRKPGDASSPFSRRLVDSRPSTNRAGAQSTWRSNGPILPQYSLRSPRPPHHRSSPPINQNAQSVPSPHGIKQSQKTIPTQPQQASLVPRRSKRTLQRRSSPPLLPQDDDNDTDKLSQLVGNMHL
ncbi:hypothetical protein H4R35_001114 [Dimargaris xerosporica]|nr:hypothetical protein H4R35_001114 [Dimargaris xerosporica]